MAPLKDFRPWVFSIDIFLKRNKEKIEGTFSDVFSFNE